MFTIKVNSSYVVIRNDLLSIRLGNRGNSYPDNFSDKYSIFAFLYCNDKCIYELAVPDVGADVEVEAVSAACSDLPNHLPSVLSYALFADFPIA